jgi:hypothetical protein
VLSLLDYNTPGLVEGTVYTATDAGIANSLSYYFDSNSTAVPALVGLYADDAGVPGTLLASVTFADPVVGNWNVAPLAGVPVGIGLPYWILSLDPVSDTTGTITFSRDSSSMCVDVENNGGSNTLAQPVGPYGFDQPYPCINAFVSP